MQALELDCLDKKKNNLIKILMLCCMTLCYGCFDVNKKNNY